MVAADVVEVAVDTFRRRRSQLLRDIAVFVVERRVEADLAQPFDLVVASRAADDAKAGEFCQLSSHASDRPGRGGYEHRLAAARLGDVEDAYPGREPRHAQDSEVGGG